MRKTCNRRIPEARIVSTDPRRCADRELAVWLVSRGLNLTVEQVFPRLDRLRGSGSSHHLGHQVEREITETNSVLDLVRGSFSLALPPNSSYSFAVRVIPRVVRATSPCGSSLVVHYGVLLGPGATSLKFGKLCPDCWGNLVLGPLCATATLLPRTALASDTIRTLTQCKPKLRQAP